MLGTSTGTIEMYDIIVNSVMNNIHWDQQSHGLCASRNRLSTFLNVLLLVQATKWKWISS